MSMARAWPLRFTLFAITNLAVLVTFGLVVRLTGIDAMLGTSWVGLLVFAGLFGFGGSLISLAMSKRMALMSTRAHVITQPRDRHEAWLVATVADLSERAGIGMPDVAVYQGEPNAFATGMWRNQSLVAVSTGLLNSMTQDEVRAVLAHEIAHVANGDMVTLSLLQGVVNTFVIASARIVGLVVDRVVFRNERGYGMGYYIVSIAAEIVFGILASIIVMWFSRRREYRADAGAAELVGAGPMISALRRLAGQPDEGDLPEGLAAFGIRGGVLGGLFRTHPPLQARIEALSR